MINVDEIFLYGSAAIGITGSLTASGSLLVTQRAERRLGLNPETPTKLRLIDEAVAAELIRMRDYLIAKRSDRLSELDERFARRRDQPYSPSPSAAEIADRLSNTGRMGAPALNEALPPREAHEYYSVLIDASRREPSLPVARALLSLSESLSILTELEYAVNAAAAASKLLRDLTQASPGEFVAEFARSLIVLSNRLSELNRPGPGLEVIVEAVGSLRQFVLAPGDQDLRSDFAGSLNTLSNRLNEVGRREDALGAVEEAVELYRVLASADPDGFAAALAAALNSLSNRLSQVGRREDALGAVEEAVELVQDLASADPEAFIADLAEALNTLSNCRSAVRRPQDALIAIELALVLHRGLAERSVQRESRELAGTLHNLSLRLGELVASGLGGSTSENSSLSAADEAVAIYRRVPLKPPGTVDSDLALSLHNLSNRMSSAGWQKDAVHTMEEAVSIRRELAAGDPRAFEFQLAASLATLAHHLGELAKVAEWTISGGAIRTERAEYVDEVAPVNLSSLTQLDPRALRQRALEALEQAIATYRAVSGTSTTNKAAFAPMLATALKSLSLRLYEIDKSDASLAAIEEAVALYRVLDAAHPKIYKRELATSLKWLSTCLDKNREYRRASRARKEARKLGVAQPSQATGTPPALATSALGHTLEASEGRAK
jgi:tetratricopeptide (TPR) repeat protein